MYSKYAIFNRQGVRSKVFIRTLIDIPEVKVHINHNSKERWKFNLQNNIQSVHVHKIPIFVGRSNAKTRPEAVLQYNLDTALSKICAHLKIKHMEKKMTDFQSVELIHYKPPTDTLEDIRPILNIPKFTFNVKDYPISEEELKNAKWKLPNNVFDSVNNTTPLCKKPEDLKGVDTDLFRFAMLYGGCKIPVCLQMSILFCSILALVSFHGKNKEVSSGVPHHIWRSCTFEYFRVEKQVSWRHGKQCSPIQTFCL